MSRSLLPLSRLLLIVAIAATFTGAAPAPPLRGFTEEAAQKQREAETKLDALIARDNLRNWMRQLTQKPHPVGAPFTKESAEWMASMFTSWGYQTEIEEFRVLFPTPKKRVVELLTPERYTAKLSENELPEDATSGVAGQLPVYNAFSTDGDVTAELVYVNYGVPRDYDVLEQHGIDVRGKIVIARYGGSWRGIKPKVAAEHGAVGCIIYSDPRDDGFFEGEPYPKGPFRSEVGAQRGSVADMPLYPGDPLTPGVGATANAKRIDRKDAATITKIPVLPVSWSDALPLLRALGGPVVPREWRGALPITYHFGPGLARVRLAVEFNWELVTAYDVIAKLPGSEFPDEWIIRGNHHDAWVFGADDPVSGLVAMMEEARAIGELAKSGHRPKRTIVYAAWDAEEPGLLGSTEWTETHLAELRQKAVVYINSDSNGRGFLSMSGSHSLEPFVNEVSRDVIDPQTKVAVRERARAARITSAAPRDRAEIRNRRDLPLGSLGAGSDYTPFLQHAGIASLNIGFGGEDGAGVYHSAYDSFDHFTRFGDASYAYGAALAQVGARLALRLANADVLPFDTSSYAATIAKFAAEVKELASSTREEIEERNRLVAEGTLALAQDPTRKLVIRGIEEPAPHLNFAPLDNAVARLRRACDALEKSMGPEESVDGSKRRQLNALLRGSERALLRDEGLPRRPWYRHQIYAPGFYTGYGVKTLPGIREAIEQRNWREAEEQIVVAASALDRYTAVVNEARALLRGNGVQASRLRPPCVSHGG